MDSLEIEIVTHVFQDLCDDPFIELYLLIHLKAKIPSNNKIWFLREC